MSSGFETSKLVEEDAHKLVATSAHIGTGNVDFQMEQYMYGRRDDGTYIINIRKTWEKLLLAARAIAAVDDPADVVVVSARPFAQRALLKFAAHTGATAIFGRFSPGCLTNQIQKTFKEPRLLVISDPFIDHQVITEASYVNVPVVSFCNSESPLKLVDIAIPCNNKGQQSIGLMWWMLAREVLILRGVISRDTGFVLNDKAIMPDLYIYRDPFEAEKEEKEEVAAAEPASEEFYPDADVPPMDFTAAPAEIADWAQETESANWDATKPAGSWDAMKPATSWNAAKPADSWGTTGNPTTADQGAAKPADDWGAGTSNVGAW